MFKFGQEESRKRGLILVDTKYEFGRLDDGNIILIDELHTCDSSRYWLADSYGERFNTGLEPEKMDKDCVRDWIKQNCDPYRDEIPEIPSEVKETVAAVYQKYTRMLLQRNDLEISGSEISPNLFTSVYYRDIHKKTVVIIAGSTSDEKHVTKIKDHLTKQGISSLQYYASAHKQTKAVLEILEKHEEEDRQIVYVTVAGRSNALSGVVSCNTKYPVIACPPFSDKTDMLVNIHSTLQCPSKVPVMTILEPENVAISINKIYNLF